MDVFFAEKVCLEQINTCRAWEIRLDLEHVYDCLPFLKHPNISKPFHLKVILKTFGNTHRAFSCGLHESTIVYVVGGKNPKHIDSLKAIREPHHFRPKT